MRKAAVGVPLWKQMKGRKATADDVLHAFGIVAPPVDVAGIIRALGINLQAVDHPGWYGAVASDDHIANIWVAAEDPEVRRRFTMAHELGHLLLHPSGVSYRDGHFAGRSPRERQANKFAAELLMPAWLLGPLALDHGASLPVLAGIFGVSQEAMGYRLSELL